MDPNVQILITIGSLGTMMYGMLRFMLKDIHKDLSDLKEGMKRSDEKHSRAEARLDHLYEICIELLRDKKNGS